MKSFKEIGPMQNNLLGLVPLGAGGVTGSACFPGDAELGHVR